MPKPEWGTKRECSSCAARFYDLGKTPIVCPKCGAVFELPAKFGVPPPAVPSNTPKPDTTGSDAGEPANAHDEADPLEDEDVDDEDFIDDNEDEDFKEDVAEEK